MLVLVTRPAAQAAATARELAERGHRAIVDPVLEVRPVAWRPDLEGVGAVAVTSANAAHALAGLPAALPVLAVGDATADAVAVATGRRPRTAHGAGRDLADLIAAALPAGAGAVLHLAGAETSPGLARRLVERGFAYRRAVVYEAVPSPGVGAEARAAIEAGELDAVLLYSPRSARLWTEAVTRAGLEGRLGRLIAACLSPAVAEGVAGLQLAEARVAAAPDGTALLRCLEAPP